MSHLDKEAKRMLSPQLDQLSTKRSRSVYIVEESPGGTMREMDPTDRHPPVPGSSASGYADAPQAEAGPSTPAPIFESSSSGSSGNDTLGSNDSTPKTKAVNDNSATPRAGPSNSGKEASPKIADQALSSQPPTRVAPNYDLSEEHLKKLTVREKLRKGIAMNFAQSLSLGEALRDKANTEGGLESAVTITGMMQRLDMEKNMDPELSHSHFLRRGLNEVDMVNRALTNKRPGAGEPDNYRDLRTQHYFSRLPSVVAASERLQAITGSANYHRFEPGPMPGRPFGQIMLVEDFDPVKDLPQVGKTSDATSGLMAHLWSGCAKYGYKKLELDSLVFKQNIRESRLVKRSVPGSEWNSPDLDPHTIMSLDAQKGSITMYQSLVALPDGRLQNWTWFRIRKPIVDIDGAVPSTLVDMHHSVLVFAAPSSQIEKTENKDESEKPQAAKKASQVPSLGDFSQLKLTPYTKTPGRQLTLEWKFTKDGLPSFAISPLPNHIRARGFPPDFLWVDCAPYYNGRDSWWKTVRDLAKNDRGHWDFIQQQMASNLCFVEVKSKHGAEWTTVYPESRDNTTVDVKGKGKAVDNGNANINQANANTNANVTVAARAGPSANNNGIASSTMPSASGPGVRRRGKKVRASGLRNEVRQD
ncbi:Hypothetical protein NCS54_00534000 [Fusarium falciforme]|uniref:Hypothetical protein n=1 Tax=Fusarium falciforme TaxID=195108 RepID=UPI002300B1D0|nr:Hypothetical protein NCS54_00534000 [Fusarium falciforme]WAO88016.1 Hypothetical protein NCS54_00534000 [Fusarium falciforme]